jgi:hypothetical protein
MKLAFILDPLDSLKTYKDTSFAMMRGIGVVILCCIRKSALASRFSHRFRARLRLTGVNTLVRSKRCAEQRSTHSMR